MNRKLPSLIAALSIVAVASISPAQPIGSGVPQRSEVAPASATASPAPTVSSTPASDDTADAHELLVQSMRAIDAQRSISTQLRHRISMFGHQLVGTGSYQQQGSGEERMLRLDMKVKVADSLTSMQQVCDGRFLWIRRDIGENQFLGRVDLRRIREVTRDGAPPEATADLSNFWMMLGGLPQLLSRIDSHFQFSPAREATLDDTAVWVLDGTWKSEVLAAIVPSQAEKIKAGKAIDPTLLPEQIPTQVRLIIRRSDDFPLQIEYLRQGVAAAPDQPPPVTPLLVMELFDIRLGEAIDPLVFAYKPGDKEVADHTELYLQTLGLK